MPHCVYAHLLLTPLSVWGKRRQEGLEPTTCVLGDCRSSELMPLACYLVSSVKRVPLGPRDSTSSTGCGPGCCADSSGCDSSGACTPRKLLLIVAQISNREGALRPALRPLWSLTPSFGDDAYQQCCPANREVQASSIAIMRSTPRSSPCCPRASPSLPSSSPPVTSVAEAELGPVVGEEGVCRPLP